MDARTVPRSARRRARAVVAEAAHGGRLARARVGAAPTSRSSTSSSRAPAGGGHQFLRALVRELERRGLGVETNRISGGTPACLFNSFNFDFARLRRFARDGLPAWCTASTGRSASTAASTTGRTRGSPRSTRSSPTRPCSSRDTASTKHARARASSSATRSSSRTRSTRRSSIRRQRASRSAGGAVRVIASSWSREPAEGRATRSPGWIGTSTPRGSTVTFVGQSAAARSSDVRHVGPSTPKSVARLLREHDVYLAASRDDPCSNALLEALACGLPAAYLDSGGHPELVGDGGLPFEAPRRDPERSSSGWPPISTRTATRSSSRRSPPSRTRTSRCSGCDGRALESPPVQNYAPPRSQVRVRFRLDRRLDRAAVSRAHDVLYQSDAWTQATWLGAQALKNPLDLWVYQEIMFETRPELIVETGTYRGGSALYLASLCDLMGAARSCRSTSSRCATTTRPSADHLPRRALVDGSGRASTSVRERAAGEAHARHPRLRPLAGARRGGARRVRAARARRLLPHRRGLEHRADPQGPHAGTARGDRDASSQRRTSSRSIASARSSSSPSTRAATCAACVPARRSRRVRTSSFASSARRRAPARPTSPEDEFAFVPVATCSPSSSIPGCVKT